MDQSASHTNLLPRSPWLVTRLAYAVGALSLIPAAIVGGSLWIGLATGGMPLARFGAAVFLLICGAVVIRIYQVLRYPRALEAWSSSWVATGFRGLALVTPSPFHWKQDGIVAAAVLATCAAVLTFHTVTASQRCEGIRIACVATTQVDLKRMVTLPVGTPVHFQSDVKAIDLRKNSGSRSWALSESPVVSLEASGYPPTNDADTAVRVTVETTQQSQESGSASRSHSKLIEDRCSQRFRQTPEKLFCRYG